MTGREPDDLAAGNGSRGAVQGIGLFRPVPCPVSSGAGSAAGCSHPFACSRPWPGCMGRVRGRRRSGGVNQTGARAVWGRRGRQTGDLAPGHWPGKLFHPVACTGGWAARG